MRVLALRERCSALATHRTQQTHLRPLLFAVRRFVRSLLFSFFCGVVVLGWASFGAVCACDGGGGGCDVSVSIDLLH